MEELEYYQQVDICIYVNTCPKFLFTFSADIETAMDRALVKHDQEKESKTFVISAATASGTAKIIKSLGIFVLEENDPIVSTSLSAFLPFDWGERSESDGSMDATNHLRAELCKFGVVFDRGGYTLHDTHANQSVLDFEDPKIGKFSGGTDAVIVPYKCAKNFCSRQLCTAFEYKINDLDKHAPQAMVELIAARCLSEQPEVLVVLTDLRTGAICYRFTFVESTGESSSSSSSAARPSTAEFIVIETRATLTEMGALVASFLRAHTVPNAAFVARLPEGPNRGVVEFKRQKLSHDDMMAWEHFQEFKDSTQPWSWERAQLTRDFFSEMHLPMPALTHPSLYI